MWCWLVCWSLPLPLRVQNFSERRYRHLPDWRASKQSRDERMAARNKADDKQQHQQQQQQQQREQESGRKDTKAASDDSEL